MEARFENLPPGAAIAPISIPAGKTEATAKVIARTDTAAATRPVSVIADAAVDGKTISAETTFACTLSDPARPQADVVFVLDVTGSMQGEIDGVRDGVTRFADDLRDNRIDFRLGLVAFRDLAERDENRRGLSSMEVCISAGTHLPRTRLRSVAR